MDIKDFLPKYPNIEQTKYSVLNPYDENFYETLFHKKEFYENRLDRVEMFPKERGMLTKYQVTIARYLSSNTPYDRLLMVHAMGSGKCVLPDTEIYANNNIHKIEDLWNSYNTSKISDNEGEWSVPSTNIIVNSYNEKEGRMVLLPVNKMYRQYINEPVRKITVQGHTITTTKAHKIFTEKGWTNEPEKCKYVAFPRKLIHNKGKEIDDLLIQILPWQIGEGHERVENGDLVITQKDTSILQNLTDLFVQLRDRHDLTLNPIIRFPKDKPSYLQVTSKAYRKFLEKHGYIWGSLSGEKIIPEFIMNSTPEQIKIFLRNYFDAEGSVDKKGVIEICSKSKQLISQLQALLGIFGIQSRTKCRKSSAKNGKNIMRDYYYLYISGLALRIFNDEIGFGYKYKQDVLDMIVVKKANTNTDIYPVTDILSELNTKFGISKRTLGEGLYVSGKQQLSRTRLLQVIENLKTHPRKKDIEMYIEKLEKISNNEIIFAKILSIEEYDYEGWVYDLEIDEHHNYIADGIITHNTCSAIGAIEQIKSEDSSFTGALILAKGPNVLNNFQKELVEKCTPGQYMPENYHKLTELERIHRVNKKTQYYQLRTFTKFAKRIKALSDQDIIDSFSNLIIVVDEVHNLRIQKDVKKKKKSIETYNQYHRFLHLVKNCKIIFLSGTPMKDTPDEIASVTNLLLPLDQQLPTGEDFINEYMTQVGNTHQLIPEKAEELKRKLAGKISFLREMESTVTKEFLGEKNYGKLNHFIVDPGIMSKFQTRGYKVAREKDEKGLTGVYTNARDASLFVYPDGSYGSKGFEKYIQVVKTKKMMQVKSGKGGAGGTKEYTVSSFKMNKELRDTLQGATHKETLANIRKYSVTYAKVLEQILNSNGNCFIYCALVQGSGCILFSLLLELFDYKKATGKDTTPGLRYGILTHETATPTDIRRINARYNNPDNTHGEFIKVIIGSKTVSESFSLRNVIFEAILTPWWNYSETAQALARGIRLGSHNDLVNPVVNIMQTVAIPNDDTPSIDLLMYETSEDKEISIRSILRILMEAAFDCGLNYMRNHLKGKKGSRECDYASCNYNCYGMNMENVKNGLDESELDYSTYQLYYANPKTPLIRKKIENIFRENYKTDLQSIIKNLQGQFTEEEIRNSLYIIQEESESDEFDYRNFLRIYSRTPVKQIINKIEEIFREHFRMNFDSILEQLPKYSEFEILTALQIIINDSVILMNKYGLPSYLREEKNIFFLVNSLSIESDFYTEYYSKFPHIVSGRSFEQITNRIYSMSLPQIINKICKTQNMKDFGKLMKSLPIKVQEMFIEASIVAKDKDIDSGVRNRVLEFFESYIKKVDDTWVSTFLVAPGREKDGDEVLRCREVDAEFNDWKDCDERYENLLQEKEVERQQVLRTENKYGIMGKYNPENGAFCIVDFEKEKAAQTKRSKSDDKRLTVSGKVCSAGGWKIPDLVRIVAQRLKIPPPENFRASESRQKLLARINKVEKFNLSSIFTKEEIDEGTDDDLRRMLYWGTTKAEKGNRGGKPICEAMRKWFEENNLLEIDHQCGKAGKAKTTTVSKPAGKAKETTYRIETFIPSKQEEEFKAYSKEISRLMGECFNEKKYKPEINDNMWIMVFSRKKLVGFMTIDNKNIISNVCVAKNYRRNNIAMNAMKQATQFICTKRGKTPTIMVDNRSKDYKRLVHMYESFGFTIEQNDGRFTQMSHSCKA